MIRITGFPRDYPWGSTTAIPHFLGQEPSGVPVAELWFGAHPLGSAEVQERPDSPDAHLAGEKLLRVISNAPEEWLGPSTQYAFGNGLPYLMKLIAPASPLSLQVHPNKEQARRGYAREQGRSLVPDDPGRIYRDWNHKPEMLYALEPFEAFAGFSVRRQVRGLLEGMKSSLAGRLDRRLRLAAGRGMRPVVAWLLDEEGGPSPEEVMEFCFECASRLASGGSPAPILDAMIVNLCAAFPGDPGIAVSFLMNPVRLRPGEALFIPPGTLHSYHSGLGLELMANSDNVIRAGLTAKHIDREQLIEAGTFDAHPPLRIAPECPSPQMRRFAAPVEDFLLTVADLDGDAVPLPGSGPRLIICLRGNPQVTSLRGDAALSRGECVFLSDKEGPALVSGSGVLAQCSVP